MSPNTMSDEKRKEIAAFVGTQMLLDTFDITEKRVKEITDISHEITIKNKDPVKTVRELRETFTGKELAYVMFRYGMNCGIAFEKVFKGIPSPASW
jgi:hypothetical protein